MHCLIAPDGAPSAAASAALDAWLARATEHPPLRPDPLDLHTPAERWLGHVHGLDDHAALPLAAWRLGERTLPCAFLSPIHIQVEAAQVVALPQHALALGEAESHALFESLAPLFPATEGWRLTWLSPLTWAVAHEQLDALRLASVARVANRPLTPWLPQERNIRRWTNEVQMLWHTHPVNAERGAQGRGLGRSQLAVNSVWWWGAGHHAGVPPADLQVLADWPEALDLPPGSVLALAGEQQVRSFEVGRQPGWRRVWPTGWPMRGRMGWPMRRRPRAADIWASL